MTLILDYGEKDRKTELETLYKRQMAIQEKALGKDHPDVGRSLTGLAGVYVKMGNYADAEQLYTRAITIAERTVETEPATFSRTLNHSQLKLLLGCYAGLLKKMDRTKEAEVIEARAKAIRLM